jgi:hypothetical protein
MQIKLTPIIPQPLNVSGMIHALTDGMRDLGIEIRENFEDTTKTWNTKARWDPPTSVPKVGIDMISVETTTEDLRYLWINSGTKKDYPITAVNAKSLAFPSQFIPKTFPGIIGSGIGFKGVIDRFPVTVIHPGVEARNFDTEIKTRMERNAKIIMDRAIDLARKASKHAYP